MRDSYATWYPVMVSEQPRPRLVQLTVSCLVLGVGVALLLAAALGSDGYSTLVNGISISLDVPFLAVNVVVGALFVAIAWLRAVRPGWGTLVQPVLVGATINVLLDVISTPGSLIWRGVLVAVAFPILAVGVAGYLASGAGAGPTEAAALAFDPPVPFRWSYSVLQGSGALVGWLLGAAIGPGTLLVIFLLGPMVDLIAGRVRVFDISVAARRTTELCTAPPLVVDNVTCGPGGRAGDPNWMRPGRPDPTPTDSDG